MVSGWGRTRTYGVSMSLIYSQVPSPLGHPSIFVNTPRGIRTLRKPWALTMCICQFCYRGVKCIRRDSNPQSLRQLGLNQLRIPIPPRMHKKIPLNSYNEISGIEYIYLISEKSSRFLNTLNLIFAI